MKAVRWTQAAEVKRGNKVIYCNMTVVLCPNLHLIKLGHLLFHFLWKRRVLPVKRMSFAINRLCVYDWEYPGYWCSGTHWGCDISIVFLTESKCDRHLSQDYQPLVSSMDLQFLIKSRPRKWLCVCGLVELCLTAVVECRRNPIINRVHRENRITTFLSPGRKVSFLCLVAMLKEFVRWMRLKGLKTDTFLYGQAFYRCFHIPL